MRIHHTHQVTYVEVADILEYAQSKKEQPFIIICDGLEDPRNFGAIIRTAECAGVHGVIIPKRRSVHVTDTVIRTSTGAAKLVPIAQVSNISQVIENLKEKGMWIIGLDHTGDKLHTEVDYKGPVAIVIGSEGDGISQLVKRNCDFLVKIPMKGEITSLNASVAAAIVMYEVVRVR